MHSKTLLIVAVCLTIVSCSKKQSTPSTGGNGNTPTQPTGGTQKCEIANAKLSTTFSLSQGANDENVNVTYNNGLISSIKNETPNHQMNGSATEYIYSGTKLVRINRKQSLNGGNPSSRYDSIYYHGNGQISLIKTFNENGSLYGGQIFYYTGNNLTRKEFTWNGSLTNVLHFDTYTYTSDGLLQKVQRFSSSGVENDNILYTYYNDDNKLFNDNPYIDIIFHNAYGGEQDIIYLALLNNKKLVQNITHTVTGQAPVSYSIAYDLNNNGYPTVIKSSNQTIITYTYNCK